MRTQAQMMAERTCSSAISTGRDGGRAGESLPRAVRAFLRAGLWCTVLRVVLVLRTLLRLAIACPHWHKSRPITPREVISPNVPGGRTVSTRETYVTCLDCGQRFVYDWEIMRLVDFWGIDNSEALTLARRRFAGLSSYIRDLAAGYTVGILPTSRWPVSLWLNRLNMRISVHEGNPRKTDLLHHSPTPTPRTSRDSTRIAMRSNDLASAVVWITFASVFGYRLSKAENENRDLIPAPLRHPAALP